MEPVIKARALRTGFLLCLEGQVVLVKFLLLFLRLLQGLGLAAWTNQHFTVLKSAGDTTRTFSVSACHSLERDWGRISGGREELWMLDRASFDTQIRTSTGIC